MDTYSGMAQADFLRILESISRVRVGIVGDLCLDMYMMADMRLSELSREVPNYTLPVVEERTSPGGAGNVAANLAALAPAQLRVLGVLGDDWRGRLLEEALRGRGVPTDELLCSPRTTTNAYIKPVRYGHSDVAYESPRLDYENRAPLNENDESALLQALERISSTIDILCVCDQLQHGCITGRIRERVCAMAGDGLPVIVDSRDRIAQYRHVIVKPNEIEGMRALGIAGNPSLERLTDVARQLSRRNERPAIVTLGENGCLAAENGTVVHVPARRVPGPTDICGAGDTFLASFSCAFGSGASIQDAAALGNLSASVTIAKLGETGTATREELCRAYSAQASDCQLIEMQIPQ